MNRKRRMHILIDGSRDLSKKMARQIEENHSVEVLMEPQEALTMIKMRETAKKSLFYLGEVLVTECKVRVNHQVGMGIVVGIEPDLAYYLAVIDAAFEAQCGEVAEWLPLLAAEEQRIAAEKNVKASAIHKTKVSFETMDV